MQILSTYTGSLEELIQSFLENALMVNAELETVPYLEIT